MESQLTASFHSLAQTENASLFNMEITLHNYLATWKQQHRKYKKYRKEDFCYDGFMWSLTNSSHSVLYIFDYNYNDRQTRRRLNSMQSFISRHSIDSEINNSSISRLVLNKTNSKCIDTITYVQDFEEYILYEIALIKPTMIIACGCYEIVTNIFTKPIKSDVLSAIKNIPILKMLPPTFKIKDKWFQLHFEDTYFRMFRMEYLKEVRMKSKIVRKLCYDLVAENIEMPRKYYKKGEKFESLKGDLAEKLESNSDKELLEKICDTKAEMCEMEIEEYFVYGFSLGMHLATESFDINL